MTLTRELAESRLSEARARHEAEGLKHLARIVEVEADIRHHTPEQLRRFGSEQTTAVSASNASGTIAMREHLELSNGDLEVLQSMIYFPVLETNNVRCPWQKTREELRWWEEHGPQLLQRSDELACQLENATVNRITQGVLRACT